MRRLRLIIVAGLMAATLALGTVGSTSAQAAGPCNDTNGDGSPSGFEYAQFHIVENAHAQNLGAGGHIPGHHKGFSACDPSSL